MGSGNHTGFDQPVPVRIELVAGPVQDFAYPGDLAGFGLMDSPDNFPVIRGEFRPDLLIGKFEQVFFGVLQCLIQMIRVFPGEIAYGLESKGISSGRLCPYDPDRFTVPFSFTVRLLFKNLLLSVYCPKIFYCPFTVLSSSLKAEQRDSLQWHLVKAENEEK